MSLFYEDTSAPALRIAGFSHIMKMKFININYIREFKMKVLIAEDDKTIAEGLSYSLTSDGNITKICETVKEAIEAADSEHFDIYLLDLTLPDGTGYEICRHIKKNRHAPVIFLTACDDEINVVQGLDMGADDYITKPFRIRELISRMKTALRHYETSPIQNDVLTIHKNITVNTKTAKVYKDGSEVILTALEYKLLLVFLNNRGNVLSRSQLLDGIWDVNGNFVDDNTLSVYIKRLREKLEDNSQKPKIIITARGLGYKMEDDHD